MGFFSGSKGDPKEIAKVNVLGVRTSEETKGLSTVNFGTYSILIEYTDGSRELKEISGKEMKQYLPFIPMI